MLDPRKNLTDLMRSLSGIMIFIALAYYIELNGLGKFSWIIIIVGVWMLFWPETIERWTKKIPLIQKPLILTLSHILIFIGLKTYLDTYIANYAWAFALIGVLFLNYNQLIAKAIFPKEKVD